jgi:hypothetical protein
LEKEKVVCLKVVCRYYPRETEEKNGAPVEEFPVSRLIFETGTAAVEIWSNAVTSVYYSSCHD